MQAALPGLKSLISTGQDRLGAGGSGTAGTGTSGTALTGPAKIIADSKGTVFDTGDPFLNLVAHHESGFRPNIGWGDTDLSGYKLNANGFPDWPGKPGPQGNSTAAGLFQITRTNWNKYAPPLIAAGVMKPDFSPESQIAVAKSMMAANGKSDWLPYNPALAAAYNRGDVVKVPGSAASPQTAGPPTATQPPAPTPQQTANGPPTGLLTPLPGGALPPGSEGATPGPQTGLLAPRPPGAGPIPPTIARNSAGQPYQPIEPGGAVAAGTPGAGPVITPQQAAAANAGGGRGLPVMPSDYIFGTGKVAPPGAGSVSPDVAGPPQAPPGQVSGLLSPAAVAVAQGIARQQAGGGLPPGGAVAGPGAPSEPPADAAAARAAAMGQEGGGIPGLLQQPPAGATPTGPAPTGPPVAPSLNLPPIPSQMPAMPNLPAVQPTPQQQIAQGVAGLMALSGHPAPPWIDDLAKMPAQMAMEQYKAWVGGQANMMTEQYKKQIEVAAAGTISYLQSQGQLPADLTKMTTEQNLKLRNELAIRGMQINPTTGRPEFTPDWIEMQGKLKVAEAQANAGFQFVDVPVRDAKGNLGTVKMSAKDAAAYLGNANQSLMPQAPGMPGTTPGAPAAGGASGTPAALQPAITPYFTPGQKAQEEAVGTALGEEYKEVGNEARTGFQAKPYLLSIQQAMQTFDNPGAGAQTKLDTLKAIQGTLNGVGVQLTPTLQDWIAKGEVMGKSGTQLGFELAKSLGTREAASIVNQAIRNNPGIETSASGNRDLTALMGAIIDRNQDKLKFYNEYYPKNNNSFMGAQQAFNAWNPPEVMVSKIAPYLLVRPNGDRMSRAEYDKLPAGVTVKKPDGSTFTKSGGAQ